MSKDAAYKWYREDPRFRASWDSAIEAGTDLLEDAAMSRAVEGVRQPIYQRGKLVGTKREYSDGLAMFLLKARRPHKYRERLEVSGDPGAPLAITEITRRVIDVTPKAVAHHPADDE